LVVVQQPAFWFIHLRSHTVNHNNVYELPLFNVFGLPGSLGKQSRLYPLISQTWK
jgi:hypothetical protein